MPPEKYEKLSGVVKKVISQAKVVIREGEACLQNNCTWRCFWYGSDWQTHWCLAYTGGFFMPVDEETKLSKGFAFVEFNSPEVSQPTLNDRLCRNEAVLGALSKFCDIGSDF